MEEIKVIDFENEVERTKYIQTQSLEILKVFHDICEEYNLKYFLHYGTLIGAIRHQGFIPWDDDLDVAMPREDYEAFLKIAEEKLPNNMFLQSKETDINYYVLFAKIRKIDTPLQEQTFSHFQVEKGVWIDIFPFDYCVKDSQKEIERIQEVNENFKLRKYLFPTFYAKDEKFINFPKTMVKKFVVKTLENHQKKPVRTKLLRKLDSMYYKTLNSIFVDRGKLSEYYMRTYATPITYDYLSNLNKGVVEQNDFEERILVEFEGYRFYAPKNFDQILRNEYGDYMKLPPKSERKNTHKWVIENRYLNK